MKPPHWQHRIAGAQLRPNPRRLTHRRRVRRERPAQRAAMQAHLAQLSAGCRRTRDENWKYANLRPLEKVRFAPPAGEAAGRPSKRAICRRHSQATCAIHLSTGCLRPALSSHTLQPRVRP